MYFIINLHKIICFCALEKKTKKLSNSYAFQVLIGTSSAEH